MKVVIAGGRDYRFTQVDIDMLNSLHAEHGFTEVFSGGCGRRSVGGLRGPSCETFPC